MSAAANGGLAWGRAGSVLRLRSARIALAVLAAVAVLAAFGPALAPQGPLTLNTNSLFQGPSWHHLLGTDYLGRDVLSRLMAGTPLSVLTALEAVGIGMVLGIAPGIASTFLGRGFDFVANRVADALMTLPSIFFAVAVTAALGNGLVQAMVPIGVLLAPAYFRITRAATLEYSRAQYVEAAELMGASKFHLVKAHVVRKVFPNIVVTTASLTAGALLAVSQAPWAPFIPGALIAVSVGALNALADAFRDRGGRGALALPQFAQLTVRTGPTLEDANGSRRSVA